MIMKKTIASILIQGSIAAATAQFQVNPQMGLTYQHLTAASPGTSYKAAAGWHLGADLRFGDRLHFQPGAFLGRNATVVTIENGENLLLEDDLIRTNLKVRALVGYKLVDTYEFDLRFMAGPSYDVLLSMDNRHDAIEWNDGDLNRGSLNFDAGLGFDMGYFTLSPTASFGLSRVFSDATSVKDINSRYITYGLTIGVNFGDDDK